MSTVDHIASRPQGWDLLDVLDEHMHSQSECYPELADAIEVQKAAGEWAAFPTPVEIIPADIITKDFDLHWIDVFGISANGQYAMAIYVGPVLSEVRIGCIAINRNAVQSIEGAQPIQTRIIKANSRISASLSSGNAGQDTVDIKIQYHTY